METLEKLSKELKVIELTEIALVDNVRHKHLWHLKSYNPTNINHYNMEDIVRMAITIVDNIIDNKPPFDNEPAVWFNETTEYYEVQTGNTRAITLSYLQEIVNKNVERFEEVFSDEEIEKALENCHTGNFAIINRELTESEKRRENNTRSEQHWLSTALGYYSSIHNGVNVKKLASQEGVSVKKVLELSNLNRLPAKAKKLCLDNIINEKVAIALSKLDKTDISLVVDHIIEKEYEKVNSPKMLMGLLESSYNVLEDDYPFESFETENRKYPHVDTEPWYIRIEDGMFIKHLSKDVKASNFRRDIYWDTIHKELHKIYPEAKVLKKVPKGMTITDSRTCIHGKPFILGKKIVFGCKSSACRVHGFKVELTEEEKESKKEKINNQNFKETLEKCFNEADSLRLDTDPSISLNIIALDFVHKRLNKKGKEATLAYLNTLIDSNAEEPILVEGFEFTMLLGSHDTPTKYGLVHLFGQEKFEWISQFMSLQWLKSNKHLKQHVDAYLSEYGLSVQNSMIDEDSIEMIIKDEIKYSETKLVDNIARDERKKSKVLDFLVHMLGINIDSEGVHIDEQRVKNYILGSHEKDRVDVTMDGDKIVVGLTPISKNYYMYAETLGIFKKDDEKYKNFDEVQVIDLVNKRVNELAPFVGDYWNQEEEDKLFKSNLRLKNAALVYNSIYSHFEESTDLFFKGKLAKDIIEEALEMVNVTFKTAFNSKKLKISIKESMRNEETWRVADVGLSGNQIEEMISWHIPTYKIHKILFNG